MSTAPRLPGDQTYDGLLVPDDLPAGWHLPSRFPGERPDDASGAIDALLGYDDQTATGEEREAELDSEQNETIDGRWRYIEHTKTATRVFIRLQRQLYGIPEEDPITSQILRELPTARIEAAINKRLFAMTRTSTISGGKIELPSGRKVAKRDLLKGLGDPKQTPDFYELVALQHGRLAASGDANPSATMAEISGVALSTAQGWVAKARARGLLPPGRRGRAG